MGIVNYLNETKAEMKHVTWPSRGQAIVYTGIIIILSLFIAAFLGFFDYLFSTLLQKFII